MMTPERQHSDEGNSVVKAYRAVAKLLTRIGDLPLHILVFRFYPFIFIVSGVLTAIVMYTIYFIQNIAFWAGDYIDRVQSFISLHS